MIGKYIIRHSVSDHETMKITPTSKTINIKTINIKNYQQQHNDHNNKN